MGCFGRPQERQIGNRVPEAATVAELLPEAHMTARLGKRSLSPGMLGPLLG